MSAPDMLCLKKAESFIHIISACVNISLAVLCSTFARLPTYSNLNEELHVGEQVLGPNVSFG